MFEYPELERTDAKLVFPGYTSLEPKTVEDIRHVTAVEGTELTLLCRLNKDVATARLVDAEGKAIDARARAEDANHVYRATITLADPSRYQRPAGRPRGADQQAHRRDRGERHAEPPAGRQDDPAGARRPRSRRWRSSGSRPSSRTISAWSATASATRMAGHEPERSSCTAPAAASRRVKTTAAEHLLDFESLQAVPDQLVTYFFWAEDIGPDGQPRRASGDMFFAEVRHFEEIFRQGEQPPADRPRTKSRKAAGNAQRGRPAGRAAEGDHQRHLEADPPRDRRQADRQVRRGQQDPARVAEVGDRAGGAARRAAARRGLESEPRAGDQRP